MAYWLHLLIILNIYLIITLNTNLIVGMANLVSLGQAAFYGLGAYFGVFALKGLGLSLEASILIAFLMTALMGLIFALPIIRLRGDYFILGTLGFQLIVYSVLLNWIPVTRGPFGISGIPAPKVLGVFAVSGQGRILVLCAVLTMGTLWFHRTLSKSSFGRVLRALRDDEIGASSLGWDVSVYKVWACLISGGFIGIAGFLYAVHMTYIDPSSFNLDESIFILTALLIGGLGNLKGPIAGALFIVFVPEMLRLLGVSSSIGANLRQIIYGIILILLMRIRPQGILGEYRLK